MNVFRRDQSVSNTGCSNVPNATTFRSRSFHRTLSNRMRLVGSRASSGHRTEGLFYEHSLALYVRELSSTSSACCLCLLWRTGRNRPIDSSSSRNEPQLNPIRSRADVTKRGATVPLRSLPILHWNFVAIAPLDHTYPSKQGRTR